MYWMTSSRRAEQKSMSTSGISRRAGLRKRSKSSSCAMGSASQMRSYVLRICDADPIAHELLFERFLNPARREMPDVDIDFCSARRDEVIQYIYERFGHDKVAM